MSPLHGHRERRDSGGAGTGPGKETEDKERRDKEREDFLLSREAGHEVSGVGGWGDKSGSGEDSTWPLVVLRLPKLAGRGGGRTSDVSAMPMPADAGEGGGRETSTAVHDVQTSAHIQNNLMRFLEKHKGLVVLIKDVDAASPELLKTVAQVCVCRCMFLCCAHVHVHVRARNTHNEEEGLTSVFRGYKNSSMTGLATFSSSSQLGRGARWPRSCSTISRLAQRQCAVTLRIGLTLRGTRRTSWSQFFAGSVRVSSFACLSRQPSSCWSGRLR